MMKEAAQARAVRLMRRARVVLATPVLVLVLAGWLPGATTARAGDSATYEWVDEKGTLTFTDDPKKVPTKPGRKVKKRRSVKGEAPQAQPGPEKAAEPEKREAGALLQVKKLESHGGHEEPWWREQFLATRGELEKLKGELDDKKHNLKVLHYRKTISNSAQTEGIFGNPRQNRVKYRDALEEIRQDEARIEELEQKLAELERMATEAAVPLEWRR